jgi:hypothetical protein
LRTNQPATKMERPSEKNVRKHDEQDNDGEVAPTPLMKRKDNEKSAPNHTGNDFHWSFNRFVLCFNFNLFSMCHRFYAEYGHLIAGLGNDMVLGEVMTRLPWYQRPILTALNRSWAHALTHSFPPYARIHHPRILSKLIVLFRTPRRKPPCNSNEDLALWVYSCNRPKMWSLPVPPIPLHLQEHVRFVCDDNDECIYSFTCVREKGVYDVEVVDLREGSFSPWKRLPSLPICTDNCEYYVYRCSSTSTLIGNCSITYIIYMRKTIETMTEEEPHDFSQWAFTLTDNAKHSEGKWQCQRFSSRPFVISAEEKKPPFYVEIDRRSKWHWRGLSNKSLYQRCERLDDSEPPFEHWGSDYILLFREGTADQPAYSFYKIKIFEYDVHLYKMKVRNGSGGGGGSKRIVEDDEGAPFWNFWESWIDGSNLLEEGEERSAIKVSCEDTVCVGKGLGKRNDINVQVAQRSHSLYLYRLISL